MTGRLHPTSLLDRTVNAASPAESPERSAARIGGCSQCSGLRCRSLISTTLATRRRYFSSVIHSVHIQALTTSIGQRGTDDLAADAQHIGVGVRPRQRRAERVLRDGGVDPEDLVRDHRAAVADAVDEDPAVDLAGADRERGRIDEIGQVDGVLVVRAEIDRVVAVGFQQRGDLPLQLRIRHGHWPGRFASAHYRPAGCPQIVAPVSSPSVRCCDASGCPPRRNRRCRRRTPRTGYRPRSSSAGP